MSDASEESQDLKKRPHDQAYPCGTRISKRFEDPDTGIRNAFVGRIKHFEFIENEGWLYFVKYEDGDTEHMTEEEVAKCVMSAARKKRKNRAEDERSNLPDRVSIQRSQSKVFSAEDVSSSTDEEEFVVDDCDDDDDDAEIIRNPRIHSDHRKPRIHFDQPPQTFPSGTLITKRFADRRTGKIAKFRGKVRRFEFIKGEGWQYFVRYEDGNTEHMTEDEISHCCLAKKNKNEAKQKMGAKRKRSARDEVEEAVSVGRSGARASAEDDAAMGDEQSGKMPLPLDDDTSCLLCKQAPVRRPRVSRQCFHIFCKSCIRDFLQQNGNKCPVCNVPTVEVTREQHHDGFKHVEALNRQSGEVVRSFDSASTASIKLERVKGRAVRIIDACRSKARDEKEFAGFLWRFQGSKERILRWGEAIADGFAVEQVCLETGNVIDVFSSYRKAAEKTGVGRIVIQRVVRRKGRANGGGFFWRRAGETHGPWPDPEPSGETAVEKLCLETGEVLEEFQSLAEAKRHMGMKENNCCIRDCCNGSRMSARGFYWRWRGTNNVPDLQGRSGKIVILRRSKHGRVYKEFPTAKEAAKSMGMTLGKIARWCRDEAFQLGYWWSYANQDDGIPQGEKVVGKRLRLSEDGSWIDGKVVGYKGKSGKHVVEFDSGETRKLDLSSTAYEWKNDQGQKAVEKLDLETGEVLETYESISMAAASTGNEHRIPSIVGCARGRVRSAGGFFWRYKGSTRMPRRLKTTKVVEQICLETGKVIGTYKSISDAGRAVGITTPGISYCCNGRNNSKSAGGFGWRFGLIQEPTAIKQEPDA